MPAPQQAICTHVLQQRYALEGEASADDVLRRVAHALSERELPRERAHWYQQFLWALRQGLVPAGRILAGAGRQGMLINCFVLPVSGPAGLNDTLAEAAATLRMGGGVGYDFSALAPTGAGIGGPVSAIRELDEACQALITRRHRPGAQMAVLRCDHPDILTFIHAKDRGGLSTFNVSVALTEAFMRALECDAVMSTVPARTVWREILRSAYDHGEPGVLFMDRINHENNLSYCEQISATNPCAEQPLPPYGACCLASIDLTRLVLDPFGPGARLNLVLLVELVKVAVRLLDNVLDLSTWPLSRQRQEAMLKRRIGLGITGLGDALVMLGLRYDSAEARRQAAQWMQAMRDAAYQASCNLALQRGAFPLFEADAFLKPPHFAARLPLDIQNAIRRQGLRHSHLLAVAPAGSISLALCDNVSSGIEPVHAWRGQRRLLRSTDKGAEALGVEDHAWRLYRQLNGADAPMGEAFVTAHDIAPADHVAMVAALAPFVDGSISKTVNVRDDLPLPEFEAIYLQAWKAGLKGLASYRPNAVLPPPLMAASSSCGRGCPSC